MAVSFKGAHFPPDVILMGIRWYLAYPLSTRHVEELLEERGVNVDHSTINRWIIKYTYCMPLFCSPLHHVTCCEYNRFPTRTQHWQAKVRRRKDDIRVGTAARGIVERLHRFP
jgi:hypothetical protein